MHRFSSIILLSPPFGATTISTCWVGISDVVADDDTLQNMQCFIMTFCLYSRNDMEASVFTTIWFCQFFFPVVIRLTVYFGIGCLKVLLKVLLHCLL